MSNYINTTTGEYPVSFARMKKALPNMSFSTAPSEAGSFKKVNDGPIPAFNGETQFATEGAPILVDGSYVRNWVVGDYTEAQIAQKQANKDASAATSVRRKRDTLLADTDWMALSDVAMSAEMTAYRQALRDLTDHVNFPHLAEEDWPVKP